jgi:hypothetical protein
VYNRTPAYDEIVYRMKKTEEANDPEKPSISVTSSRTEQPHFGARLRRTARGADSEVPNGKPNSHGENGPGENGYGENGHGHNGNQKNDHGN